VFLPFDKTGTIKHGSTDLGEISLSIWPSGESTTPAGEAYDWEGEAHEDSAELLVGKGNRMILVEGQRYAVVSAFFNGYVPHVELRLRSMEGRVDG
jgi:hypothetical protein